MTDRSQAWLFLIGAILLEVTGSLSLKGALDAPILYGAVIAGYGGAFICLSMALRRRMPLGVAYGIWGAVGVVLTAVLSQVLFDEALTALTTLGIAVIVAGVLLVEVGSHPAPKAEAA